MPLKNQLHVDQLLSNISVRYKNQGYIADQVFPTVAVKKDSDLFRVYDRNFRLPETKRGSTAEAREFNFDVSTSSYILAQNSLVNYISDRDAENYDIADLRADMTEVLTDALLLKKEKDCADLFTSTSWSLFHSLSTAQQFSLDTVTSNPVPQFDTATTVVLENSGKKANVGIIPHRALVAIKNHTSVIDRIKYTSADITPSMIAGLLDIQKLLVPTSVIDNAHEGLASSIAAVWGDNCWLGYVEPSPGPMKPSAGYCFENALPLVKRWREEKRQSEAVEVNKHYQIKIVASLCGYLFKDVLA